MKAAAQPGGTKAGWAETTSGEADQTQSTPHGGPRDGSPLQPEPPSFVDRYAAASPLEFIPIVARRNHNVFRYPAKFHPPIARELVRRFSVVGDTVLDPFCGSGTLLVEAATLGRHSIGIDVDPLAIFVARAKTTLSDVAGITRAVEAATAWLDCEQVHDETRWGSFEKDIDEAEFAAARQGLELWIPDLPRISHWFRRRVIIQLAMIRRKITSTYGGEARRFLMLCFASILRHASNADPIPISGLEVTSHMLAKEKNGRVVDPWRLLRRAVSKSLQAMIAFITDRKSGASCILYEADARLLNTATVGKVDAIVTSPPYLTAVDYYRRHTLEMYWLGLTECRNERLELMKRYIGRDRVGAKQIPDSSSHGMRVAKRWLPRFPDIMPERERAFRHYCDGMARSLAHMACVVAQGGPIVIVAGDVRFCGKPVSMLELMKDLAGDQLGIAGHFWYPIVNRYMSYKRNNEANIAADHVLVFRSRLTERERRK